MLLGPPPNDYRKLLRAKGCPPFRCQATFCPQSNEVYMRVKRRRHDGHFVNLFKVVQRMRCACRLQWMVVAVLLCFATSALACGMTTHTEIAHRSEVPISTATFLVVLSHNKSQGWFDDAQLSSLLLDNVDAFEAGAPFPDWGYRLEIQHQRTVLFS